MASSGSEPQIHMITRKPGDFMRETKHDIHRVQRNYDPKLHPFALQREYQRALNATKLERVFAKPFIGNMSGHGDIASTLMKHQTKLSIMASGAYDGVIKIWNITNRKCIRTIQAHDSQVRSMCISRLNSNHFFSVDSGSNIKKWCYDVQDEEVPIDTILAKHIILGMDHHYDEPYLITSGDKVELWEENRKEPIRQWSWGADSTHYCKYNPVEVNLFATLSSDRSISLFDMRKPTPLRKVVLAMRSNQLCWNPMEAFKFTVANEDHDLHTFDMRQLEKPLALHKDHTAAVISLDYSPTGSEIVSGSYDKTIRIFPSRSGHSRDVYYTKRMQKITDVIWTLDNKYIVSASDEMDIRMWRASASAKIGPMYHRQQVALETSEALKKKFQHHPEIRRISKHRHLPKHVYNERKLKRTMLDARKRKEDRRRANSKPGSVPVTSEKGRQIVRIEE